MSNALQLFRVTVTQTWSAEVEALVLAADEDTARTWADLEVDVDLMDAVDDGTEVGRARPEPFDTIQTLTKQKAADLWLIAPITGRPDRCRTVDLDELLAELDPEQLETMRIAAIEKDNGQLSLLEVA